MLNSTSEWGERSRTGQRVSSQYGKAARAEPQRRQPSSLLDRCHRRNRKGDKRRVFLVV
ncbi:uncharacterized protein P884DRAFT_262735 [Thermothelomyces heterothallicus CBS 202.75]|uniref:uncharacterized protein n=1 Tax=Thermothelomyces heterothallicus CBS 202.75 TaxID=1149848 RepID=UPI003741F101